MGLRKDENGGVVRPSQREAAQRATEEASQRPQRLEQHTNFGQFRNPIYTEGSQPFHPCDSSSRRRGPWDETDETFLNSKIGKSARRPCPSLSWYHSPPTSTSPYPPPSRSWMNDGLLGESMAHVLCQMMRPFGPFTRRWHGSAAAASAPSCTCATTPQDAWRPPRSSRHQLQGTTMNVLSASPSS